MVAEAHTRDANRSARRQEQSDIGVRDRWATFIHFIEQAGSRCHEIGVIIEQEPALGASCVPFDTAAGWDS
jgi:hypothetical protein